MEEQALQTIYGQFDAQGAFLKGYPYGSGHIHDTFRIETDGKGPGYILQRINTNIFKDVDHLQQNILRVTEHIRKKLSGIPGSDPDRETLTLIPTRTGASYLHDGSGYWRCYLFIDRHRSYDRVETAGQAYQGGRAIGRFEQLIAGLDPSGIHEVLPAFHDMEVRLDNFFKVLEKDPANRAASVREDIRFVEERAEEMMTIQRLGKEGKIPLRITHNDTKFNNVLLDENDEALCVIDLDTVMPGYIHYDFGDAIRTSANSSFEDEKDLSKVFVRLDLYEAFARGFLEETREELTPLEKEYLAFSARMMTFIIGLRFLTDHLDGDNYFKIHHPGHNLERARVQFKLVSSMEEHRKEMEEVIRRLG